MRRTIPEGIAAKIKQFSEKNRACDRRNEVSHSIEIVTLYYGGGAKGGVIDRQMPVRSSSIRGHLRLWWRFLHARDYQDSQKLFEAESKVFGNVDNPSPLVVCVEQPTRLKTEKLPQDQTDPIQHALFPARTNNRDILSPCSFTLKLCYPKSTNDLAPWNQMLNALQLWCCFGGLGARSRRGCGAIYCNELSDISNVSEKDLALFNCILLKSINDAGNVKEKAWHSAIRCYQSFRQQRTRPKGRSLLSEPDVLRKLNRDGYSDSKHSQPVPGNERVTDDVSSRIMLGGPVIFQSENENALNDEVYPVHKGKTADRMASPIITRPVCCNGKWYAGIIILRSPHDILKELTGVEIKSKQKRFGQKAIQNEQLKNMCAFEKCKVNNVLDAFILYAKVNGFEIYKNNNEKRS